MKNLSDTFTLSNGTKIPCVGFGTWQIREGKAAINAVSEAIQNGYRHIDTAAAYHNEKSVGAAVKNSGVARADLFVTSKLWNSERGYDKTLRAFEKTMKALGLDYLDLYLIHWPIPGSHKNDWQQTNQDSWRAIEKLYREGQIKAIGVSNFKPHHLESLLEKAEISPMVNQIELHPGLNQGETVAFCKENEILVEAWSPLAQGKIFGVSQLETIAARYQRTTAQTALRWILQKGILPLPKSETPSRIKENGSLFDFELSPEDMQAIDGLKNIPGSGLDPDHINF